MLIFAEKGMNMPVIEKVGEDKKRFIDLLLLADEQESMIDRYLDRGNLFVSHGPDGVPTCVAVVTDEGNGVCELKNIAVAPSCWRKGYGRQMIEYLCCHYGGDFLFMTVGTGDCPQTISFYEHCGFSYSHSLPDFFTLNYDHPIVEGGKVLRDMLYFRRRIASCTVVRDAVRTEALLDQLLRLWEDSVRATHHFLTGDDVACLVPVVRQALASVAHLAVAWHAKRPVGFVGIEGRKIEMLFVAPTCLGCGFGRALADLAIREYGCSLVDVNADNLPAEGFYRYLGFEPFERSETDDQGNPFPILRMKLP